MLALAMIRSINVAIASWSCTGVSKNRAHRHGDARPLLAFRLGAAASLGGQRVVLARATRRTVPPDRLEQAIALHLVERRIDRALFQPQRLRASTLGLLCDLVAVHLPFGQEAENQHTDGAGQELAVVVHVVPGKQSIIPW